MRKQLLPLASTKKLEFQILLNLLDNYAPTNLSIYRAIQNGNFAAFIHLVRRQMIMAITMDRRNYKYALADLMSQLGWYWPLAIPELMDIFKKHSGVFDEYMVERLHSLVSDDIYIM